jgi:cyclopropane fatty-acyl-phospholipid synthase-like methyltransferase
VTTDASADGSRRGWREALAYFIWLYTPLKRMSARDIYELVATNSYSREGLYLNLGYWRDACTIDEACAALAMLVAETAEIGPGSKVVDVGFGFADQDMLWLERLSPDHIVGLNITPSQVQLARERVAARGMADRIDLIEGSATDMNLPDGAFDQVVGVECAFHFDTRERFFAEALRVLRPGGRLALADIIRAPPHPNRLRRRMQDFNWRFFMEKFAVPRANSDTRDSYAAKLGAAGFTSTRVETISRHVYPGLHHYMASEPAMLRRLHPMARLPYYLTLRLDAELVYSAYEYVLASAEKPG